jgi:periplasmic protein CpxP/Spy
VTRVSNRWVHAAAGVFGILMLLSASTGLAAGASRNTDATGLSSGSLTAQATSAQPTPAQGKPSAASTAPQTSAPPTPPKSPLSRVETRIVELHAKLKITPAQEAQFNAYADTLRSNAHAMQALFQERAQSSDMSAPGRLRWYARLTAANAEDVSKLVPAFDALYQSMSQEQQKAADKVFEELRQRRQPRRAG